MKIILEFIANYLCSLVNFRLYIAGILLGFQLSAPAEESWSVRFVENSEELGLALKDGKACWVDVDADGWLDLIAAGTYWRNLEGKKFKRIQNGLGAVVAADYNNDGFPDLFSYSKLKLYRNQQGKRFKQMPLPELPEHNSRGACWGDFNRDGFVDLYVGGYEVWERNISYQNLLFLNREGKVFELIPQDGNARTRGVTACDFDRENGLDVYTSNYRLQPNGLMLNDGVGNFLNRAKKYNTLAGATDFAGGHTIGSAWGDIDNDGWFDILVGNFAHRDSRGDQPTSRFLRNPGAGKGAFEDMGECGIYYQESYASPALGDYDNDGDLDLLLTTVYGVASFKKPNYPVLFEQTSVFEFVDVTRSAHLSQLPPSYQAAWGDYNNDGCLDLVVAGKLFTNEGGAGNWIKVQLEGDGHYVNHSAIGAQVRLELGDQILVRQVEAGTGEGNQNALVLHFGLGTHSESTVDLQIFWPDGTQQELSGVALNQAHTITYRKR
ncbi:CRTAC1 family protein [Coraliomargarita sp. SDUM461004]|uniref:CRTAC1 family protein n=1 Tax=Thalassobacterium sedimentorum TaxID=3041258 RepID=A0ABU1AJF2_9BACT|nr:CRTAC1 family protein [Coraliomargarita sp. SDUM461004]MDQ8194879.1 CRTAC1 family protein [Coraliomargarita sp. SDUM461004]